jgi:hypothetical protein
MIRRRTTTAAPSAAAADPGASREHTVGRTQRAEAAVAPPEPGSLLSPAQAGAQLGVRAGTLERWRGTGDGPAFIRLSAKTVRYRREDLEAFVAANVRRNTAE